MGVLVAEALNKVSLKEKSGFLYKSKQEKMFKSEISLNWWVAVAGVPSGTRSSWDNPFL